jgi:cytoskeletal protein RodZ
MRRDHRRPFDIDADEATDVTQEFWGSTRGWSPLGGDDDQSVDDRTPRSLQSLKSSIAGMRRRPWQPVRRSDASGRMDRTRSHGIPRTVAAGDVQAAQREATLGQLAAGWIDDDAWPDLDLAPTRPHQVVPSRRPDDRLQDAFDEDDEFDAYPEDLDEDVIPLSPVAPLASKLGLGAVDPLLARLGAIVVAGVLLLPVAMSARGGSHDALADASEAVPAAPASVAGSVAALAPAAAETTAVASTSAAAVSTPAASASAGVVATASASNVRSAPASAAADSGDDSQPRLAAATTAPAADVPQSVSAATNAPAEVATVSEPADRVAPDCSLKYEAGQGDSWYRIADAAGVTPRALMDQNLAGLETPIFPGDEICLPQGATVPAKPVVTTAPPATSAPTTAPPTTVKTTTTTVKPTSTTAPPPAPVSTTDVQALIREIWPDELEERALQIAYRESNYKSSAYNGSCCYGVFQINWSSHRSWLDDYGITSTNDLLDARKNITAAYALYQRSGGWGPWGG